MNEISLSHIRSTPSPWRPSTVTALAIVAATFVGNGFSHPFSSLVDTVAATVGKGATIERRVVRRDIWGRPTLDEIIKLRRLLAFPLS